MRQPRLTYPGAYHHCMNRGLEGRDIFVGDVNKKIFLDFLSNKIVLFKIRLFAFCIMDNHYHLLLENSSGRMSDFFRQLNSHYAFYFRKKMKNRGYVFQSRYVSTIIENDSYLKQAILYVLQNPVRANIVDHFRKYRWSSGDLYFTKRKDAWLDSGYVEDLFGSENEIDHALESGGISDFPVIRSVFGGVMGEKGFLEKALTKYNRRKQPDALKKRRKTDFYFEPVEKVIFEFEKLKGVRTEEINIDSYRGKRLRGELLVRLKNLAGLTYREIAEIPLFSSLQYLSLAHLYKNARKRMD